MLDLCEGFRILAKSAMPLRQRQISIVEIALQKRARSEEMEKKKFSLDLLYSEHLIDSDIHKQNPEVTATE